LWAPALWWHREPCEAVLNAIVEGTAAAGRSDDITAIVASPVLKE
jgi:hypothetical protein